MFLFLILLFFPFSTLISNDDDTDDVCIYIFQDNCIYGIPLAGRTVLKIDLDTQEVPILILCEREQLCSCDVVLLAREG